MDGWVGRWMNGWTDGCWMAGKVDNCVDRSRVPTTRAFVHDTNTDVFSQGWTSLAYVNGQTAFYISSVEMEPDFLFPFWLQAVNSRNTDTVSVFPDHPHIRSGWNGFGA